MVQESHVRHLLRAQAESYDVGSLDQQRFRRHQSRWRLERGLLLVACMIAVVAATGFGLGLWQKPDDGTTAAPTSQGDTRSVEFRGVSLEVPRSWGTNQVRCGAAIEDTVVFEPQGNTYCFAHDPNVSALHFVPGDLRMADAWITRANSRITVDGVAVDVMTTRQIDDKYFAAAVVEERRVVLWIEGPNTGAVDSVLNTMRVAR